MIRLSFRQSMLAGFLLIASLLSWAAVRSWLVLEQFVDASRRSGEHVLQLSGSIQELADRTVDLERSARQFVVLNEATLIARFDTHLVHALAAVGRLESIPGEALGRSRATGARPPKSSARACTERRLPSNCYRF
jgi:two-component system sensor histidine kinase GlrK